MPADFAVSTAFKAIDKTSKVLKAIAGNAKATTARMSAMFTKLERKTAIFGGRFKDTFKTGVAVAGIAALTLAMQQGIQTGLQFEQTVVNAAAKFGPAARPGTEAFKNLEAAAKDVGATTEFTASQAAEGLNFLALAGFSAEQSIAALPQVVDLATAAQVDLATASDIATDTLGAMGLATKDTVQQSMNLARVNDVLAKATTTANTSVTQLFEAITEGGPVATSAGASIEQFAALAGKLADAGIKGSRAGTTLKNVFVRLSAPTAQASRAISKLGLQTKDARGNLRDVTLILDDINKATAALGTAEKAEVLNAIFGKIPIAGVNVLLKQGGEALRDYQKTLEGAAGANKEMADVMRATTAAAVKTLKSAFEGLQLVIFDQIKPAFTDVVKGLTFMIGGWAQFLKMHPGIIGLLVTIAKIAAPVLAITAAVIGLNLALVAFNFIMAANPIGLIAIGIVAAIAAIVTFKDELLAVGAIIVLSIISPVLLLMKLLGAIPGLGFLSSAADTAVKSLAGTAIEGFGGTLPAEKELNVNTPGVATAKQISESRTESTNRVIIEDGTGRARRAENDGTGVVEVIPRNAGFEEAYG
jgi:TP901 family phage tail tape measure protein